jgi:hypothetical protein
MTTSRRSAALAAALLLSLLTGTAGPAVAVNPIPQIDGGGPTTSEPVDPPLVRSDLEAGQWHLDAIGARNTAADAGKGVTVAVISDGVWSGHPDLAGRVLDGWDLNTGRVIPASTVREAGDLGQYYGTFAAGLIAGNADRSGIRGVAPAASILPVVVESERGYGDKQVAAGIDWAAANGADIIVFLGGISAFLTPEREVLTCNAITAARSRGVPTFVAAGNEADSANLSVDFVISRCGDAIPVASLSTTLGEANGLRNFVSPTFATPSVRILSALAALEWLPYGFADHSEWSPVLAAGAAAVLMGEGLDAETAIKRLVASATDLGAPGVDALTGAGLIDVASASGRSAPRTEKDVNASLATLSAPRIQELSIDENGNTGVIWEPPVAAAVNNYRIDVVRWDGFNWQTRRFTAPGNVVRFVVPVSLDSASYVTVTAETDSGPRTSAPRNSYTIDPFEPAASPYAKVTEVDARWTKAGIQVTVSVNAEGVGADWYLTVLEGWTTQPIRKAKVSGRSLTYLFPFAIDDETRSLPLYVVAFINNERTSKGLLPQYLIDAKGLSAGASHAAVVGNSNFACMESINISSGCEGAQVRVVDSRTGKILGRSQIMSDKTFTVVFAWKPLRLRVHVEITDPDNSVRSKPIDRLLTTRK